VPRVSGPHPLRSARHLAWGSLLLLALAATVAWAHEIPARVTVRVFAATGTRTRRRTRSPTVAAMRDVQFPERADGTVDLSRVSAAAREAAQLWVVDAVRLRDDGRALPAPQLDTVRFERPTQLELYDAKGIVAYALLPIDTTIRDLPTSQAMLDVVMSVPLAMAPTALAIDVRFARLGEQTTTVLQLLRDDGSPRVLVLDGDAGELPFEPTWWNATARFVRMGIAHILDGVDHLLFLLCLVLPIRRAQPLLATVTAFTVAHSITLVATALGLAPDAAWFAPLIEVLIAASIIVMAIENVVGARVERRWALAFGFGLVHGFGFAFALRETLQFAGNHLMTALAAFNIGVELGQLAVLAVAVPVLTLIWRLGLPERSGVMIASALVAHSAWHWMADRWTALRAIEWSPPAFDATTGAMAAQLALLVVFAGGVAWGYGALVRRWGGSGAPGARVVGGEQRITGAGREADAS
jgi:hypothetical protein